MTFPKDVAAMYGRRPPLEAHPSVCGARVASRVAVWTTLHGAVIGAAWDAQEFVSSWQDEHPGAVFRLGEAPIIHGSYVYVSPAGAGTAGICYRSATRCEAQPAALDVYGPRSKVGSTNAVLTFVEA